MSAATSALVKAFGQWKIVAAAYVMAFFFAAVPFSFPLDFSSDPRGWGLSPRGGLSEPRVGGEATLVRVWDLLIVGFFILVVFRGYFYQN